MPSFSGLELSRCSIFRMQKYTGKVCSNIMKVIIHLLRSKSTKQSSPLDSIIESWDLYVDVYYYAKLPSHDTSTIRNLQKTILKWKLSLKKYHTSLTPDHSLWELQRSKWSFPKFHAVDHMARVN